MHVSTPMGEIRDNSRDILCLICKWKDSCLKTHCAKPRGTDCNLENEEDCYNLLCPHYRLHAWCKDWESQ